MAISQVVHARRLAVAAGLAAAASGTAVWAQFGGRDGTPAVPGGAAVSGGATAAVGIALLTLGNRGTGGVARGLRAAGTGAIVGGTAGIAIGVLAPAPGGRAAGTPAGSSTPPTISAAPTPTPPASPAPAPDATAPPTSVAQAPEPAPLPMLEVGAKGPRVAALIAQLDSLGYAINTGSDEYTWETRDAVMAFQKVNGLERDGVAGPQTMEALGAPRVPEIGTGAAHRVVVDLSDQTLVMVRDGEIAYIVNATTGDPNHPDGMGEVTPVGRHTVQRKIEGIRDAPLGRIYDPSYFDGGIAVHGSGSIMAYRASHGCVRVPRSLERQIFLDMPVGTSVVVQE